MDLQNVWMQEKLGRPIKPDDEGYYKLSKIDITVLCYSIFDKVALTGTLIASAVALLGIFYMFR